MTLRYPDRRGAGLVLVIALVVLLMSSVVALSRKVHASRVSGTAQTATVGALALQAATAAVDEALVVLGERANKPGDLLYQHLRQADTPGPLALDLAVPITAQLLKSDALTAGFAIGAVKATLAPRKRAGWASYEHEGRVRLVAECVHGPTGTLRRLVREHTLRVNLLGTPRPFDQATWMALRGELLIDRDANARIADAVETSSNVKNQLAPTFQAQIRETVRKMNEMLTAVGVTGALKDPEATAAPFGPEKFPAPPKVGRGVEDPFHYFPNEVILFSQADRVEDLAWLNLAPRADRLAADVARTRAASLEALQRYESARAAFESAANGASGSNVEPVIRAYGAWLGTVEPLGAALQAASQARTAQLANYQDYQEKIGEMTGTTRRKLLEQAVQLESDAMSRRATHRFGGPTANEDAVRFLARYTGPKATGSGLHAVVFVDNQGGRPFSLDALRGPDGRVTIRGKLTLACTGAVELKDVVLANGNGLCVIRAGGALTASGRVEASLIPCDELRADASLALSGNVILAAGFDPARLAGRLDRANGRYASGVSGAFQGEYTQATVAPWALSSFVER